MTGPDPRYECDFQKILIVKLGGIGDILQMTPCLEGLRRRYPHAHIAFMVMEYMREAIETHPLLDEVLVIKNLKISGPLHDAVALAQLVLQVRSRRFDVAVIANKTRWLALAMHLAGIPFVVGFSYPDRWHLLHRAVPFAASRNLQDLHWDLFSSIGVTKTPGRPFFRLLPQDRQAAEAFLVSWGVTGDFLASAPGGGINPWINGYAKRWAPGRYAQIYDRLFRDYGLPTVLLGNGEDRPIIDQVLAAAQFPPIDLAGMLRLGQTAAVLARARAFVGNDSALLYLAGAVGTPSVGVYGPTDAREFLPPDKLYAAVQGQVPCSPCWTQLVGNKSPALRCDHVSCMKAISVEEVLYLILQVLEAVGSDDSHVRGHIAKVEQRAFE